MKLKILFAVSCMLVLAGLLCLGHKVNGDANVTAGWPLSGASIRVCVTVSGGWAVAGGICTVLGILLLAAAIVRVLFFETSTS